MNAIPPLSPAERPGIRYHHLVVPPIDAFPPSDLTTFDARLRRLTGSEVLATARRGMRITIAFTDSTRHSPDHLMVGWLVECLRARGVDDNDITLLCATGLHRPMTHSERVEKLGEPLVQRLRIFDHNALASDELRYAGDVDGVPVHVNRMCSTCDLLFATGVVEPHQYAGYSGGAKTIVIGCGGERVIEATHGVSMIDREGVTIGSIAENPFQQFIRRAGARIGIDAVVNVLLDESGNVVDGCVGSTTIVHDTLIERARSACELAVDRAMDMAVIGVPLGKDASIYQASRAATYTALAEPSPLKDGAPIVLLADVWEGMGKGLAERRFGELLAGGEPLEQLLERFRRDGFPAGGQRAYVVARVLRRHPVIIAGSGDRESIRSCRMTAARDLEEGIDIAVEIVRRRGRYGILDAMVLANGIMGVRLS